MNLGLRTWMVLLALAATVPLLVFTAYTVSWVSREGRAVYERGLRDTSRAVAAALDAEFRARFAALQALAESSALQRGDHAAFYDEATAVATLQGSFVVLFDRERRQLVSTLQPFGGPAPGARAPDTVHAVLETGFPAVSDPFFSDIAQRWVVSIDVPVVRDGEVVYALELGFDIDRLSSFIRSGFLPYSWSAQVIDRHGGVVAQSENAAEDIGRRAGEWLDDVPNARVLVGRLLHDKEAVTVATTRMAAVPWTVTIAVPVADMSGAWDWPIVIFGAGGAALGLIAVVFALYLARLVVRPIRILAAAAPAPGRAAGAELSPSMVREINALAFAQRAAADATEGYLRETKRAVAAEERAKVLAESEKALREGERKLRARTAELELVMDTVPAAVWLGYGQDAGQIVASGHAVKLFRWQSDRDLSGDGPASGEQQRWRALRNGVEVPRDRLPLQRAARGEEIRGEEIEIVFDDGTRFPLLVNASPIRDDKGVPIGCVAAGVDISDRKRAEQRQNLIMAELDHRVRNVLASIRAMMTLIEPSADSKEAFAAAVRSRIDAIARAHGLLTQTKWRGAGLYDLVALELAPFMGPAKMRAVIDGRNLLLCPEAAVGVALVVHELATNAAKHGALSHDNGTVEVRWRTESRSDARYLRFEWLESGGPPAKAPARRGFGMKVVDQTLQNEFGADHRLIFTPEGLQLTAAIPLRGRMAEASEEAISIPTVVLRGGPAHDAIGDIRGKRILVVEDDVLIGLDVKEQLQRRGAKVTGPAGTLADALAAAARHQFDAAVLDVNLGREAVYPLADLLSDKGVPFAFLTGYGTRTALPERFQGRPNLQKPVSSTEVVAHVGRMIARAADRQEVASAE